MRRVLAQTAPCIEATRMTVVRRQTDRINPHFPALRADPLALSGASRRKQTPSRQNSTIKHTKTMKSRPYPLLRSSSLLIYLRSAAFAVAAGACSSSLHAQSWDGGGASNSWGTADNWDPNGVPAFTTTTDLVFNVLTRPNNFIGANRIVRSISYGADIDSTFQTNYQDFSGGASRTLTMDADSGNAAITVDGGATGAITLGSAGGTGTFGSMILADNLDIAHNGSGLLLFNRPISGTGFGITKTGNGTMQLNAFNSFTGAININQGTLIANTSGAAGQELNAASALNLGGGALEIRANFQNKNYDTVPVNVSTASTLTYNNVNNSTYTAQFSGANAFAMNADLTVKNTSTDPALVNAFNIGRAITGTGKMSVETYNNIASSADSFGLGRILLSGDNSAWNGDLVISRGTVSLSGNAVNAAGNGVIIIGTSADAFGAGLTFFPTGGSGTVTYANNITVASGGFRAIKGGGTNHSVKFEGTVTLNGNLTLDHSWSATDRRLWLSGNASGAGGLTITKAAGNAGTTALLSGTNTYLGNTTVTTGASLAIGSTGSLTSDISVQSGARIGGAGSTSKNLSLAAGANFFFFYSLTYSPFTVGGTATLDNSFGISSLVGGSQGEAINWAAVPDGTYTLIGDTASTFNTITNFSLANAVTVDAGRVAYFQNGGGSGGGGLQLVIATSGGDNYLSWATANNVTGGINGDSDNDGVQNLVEYALVDGGERGVFTPNTITFTKRAAPFGSDVTYAIEISDTLAIGSWTTAVTGVTQNPTSISYAFTPSTPVKRFARLKVSQ
jgi:autotransporter-associated beta strand protein